MILLSISSSSLLCWVTLPESHGQCPFCFFHGNTISRCSKVGSKACWSLSGSLNSSRKAHSLSSPGESSTSLLGQGILPKINLSWSPAESTVGTGCPCPHLCLTFQGLTWRPANHRSCRPRPVVHQDLRTVYNFTLLSPATSHPSYLPGRPILSPVSVYSHPIASGVCKVLKAKIRSILRRSLALAIIPHGPWEATSHLPHRLQLPFALLQPCQHCHCLHQHTPASGHLHRLHPVAQPPSSPGPL